MQSWTLIPAFSLSLPVQAAQSTDTSPAGAAATGTDLPAAAAYFPLLSSDVTSSYPAAAYEGVAHNLDWVEDPAFGQVMACDEVRQLQAPRRRNNSCAARSAASTRPTRSATPFPLPLDDTSCQPPLRPPALPAPARPTGLQARQSYVSIPGLEYGQGGGLAVAFWAKVRPHSGASMDYAYSHTNAANTDYAFDPNTVGWGQPGSRAGRPRVQGGVRTSRVSPPGSVCGAMCFASLAGFE